MPVRAEDGHLTAAGELTATLPTRNTPLAPCTESRESAFSPSCAEQYNRAGVRAAGRGIDVKVAGNDPDDNMPDRGAFLNLAGAVQGGLTLLAIVLAWGLRIDVWAVIAWDGPSIAAGVLATLPLLALFGVTYRWSWRPVREIRELVLNLLGPTLALCRWHDLVLLAALAGVGEELFFRGVLQTVCIRWFGLGAGLALASIVFGLLHAATPAYAVLATLIGVYLGALFLAFDPPNLLVPMIVHTLYDLFAFVVLRREALRRLKRARHADALRD